ncbi:MAG: hypothetical protein AAB897_04230 [Patescibacteria group bacterium]
MSRKFVLPLIIVVIALGTALFIVRPDFFAFFSERSRTVFEPSGEEPGLELAGGVRLPEGRQEYMISSSEDARPRFLSAVIDPLKVSLGDTQFMRVVIQDDADVLSVVAEIETDNDTVKVPLKLTETSALSRAELENQKYLVRDGKLVINNGPPGSPTSGGSRTSQLLGADTAAAQALKKFTFEGSWVVRDTSVREYRTKFVARDAVGRENSITMAWLDPCQGITHGAANSTTTSSCTIGAGTTEGIDGGNLSVSGSGVVLTVSGSGAIFAWNPGKTISLVSGGSLAINSGGQFQQKYLCSTDQDRDTYLDNNNITLSDVSTCTTRLKDSPGGQVDCYSALPTSTTRAHLVFPGQTSYFTTSRGDGSFDYNCDGVETTVFNLGNAPNDGCGGIDVCTYDGYYVLAPPACGGGGQYLVDICSGNRCTKITQAQGCL